MKLKSRNFVLGDVRFPSEGHPISLIPEIVGDREVYSILNQNNEHCGYMTEEMLNTILKMNEKEDIDNNIIRSGLFVDTNSAEEEPTTLAQKIIIDKFKGGNALSFTSCDFDGNTYIETKSSNPSIFYKISATNSKFTNSSLRFSSHDGSGTMINNSEVEGNFVCDSVREIAASYLENVKLESLDKVESCYLSAYIYENDGKRSSLINVNSNEDKKLPNDTKLEIL